MWVVPRCLQNPGDCRGLNRNSTWVQVTEAKAETAHDLGMGIGGHSEAVSLCLKQTYAYNAKERRHMSVLGDAS